MPVLPTSIDHFPSRLRSQAFVVPAGMNGVGVTTLCSDRALGQSKAEPGQGEDVLYQPHESLTGLCPARRGYLAGILMRLGDSTRRIRW